MSEQSAPVPPRGESSSMDSAQTLSASQIQDLINLSVQAAMASRVQQPMAPPLLPPQCGEPPMKKRKASHKRKQVE